MKNSFNKTYNQRLFQNKIKRFFHLLRFNWLKEASEGLSGKVFELGCYDARSLDYLSFKPSVYVGQDAGWEKGGIEIAKDKYPEYKFIRSDSLNKNFEYFDLVLALETVEHLNRDEIESYIDYFSKISKTTIITVPVEIGPIFLIKYLIKLFKNEAESYNFFEVVACTIGLTSLVSQNQHKGFNFYNLIKVCKKHYQKVDVRGLPFRFFPLFGFTVGIRCDK